ncbi:MAG: hypothetical protein AAF725_19860 [Acidobacteriota bacterium]
MSRRALAGFLGLWVALSLALEPPLFETAERIVRGPSAASQLDLFMERAAADLPADSEVALWWPDRSAAGLESLAHWWAESSYRFAPRRVYPLLTPREAREVEPLAATLRPFLAGRGAAIQEGEVEVQVVILAWQAGCEIPQFPSLQPVHEAPRGCVLIPARGRESSR